MAEKQAIFTMMGGQVKIMRGIYNPTCDAVWLAAYAADVSAKSVLDIGVGTGGAILCLMANHNVKTAVGIDVSQEMLDECAKNAKLNNQEIELIKADIMTWRTNRTFDLVITNPPYFKGTPANHNAHHNADIKQWMRHAVARVRPRGTICTITDAAIMGDVISTLANVCGDIKILPLFSKKNTAERVLISGRVGTRGTSVIYRGMDINCELVLRDGLTIAKALAKLG
ncbi:MAG: methyltransferase domain-containing protein [Alphaproteobacteria bacterium]|nr:methyltransferase domain-containing protein [Alphaproteobacteria bacterium]